MTLTIYVWKKNQEHSIVMWNLSHYMESIATARFIVWNGWRILLDRVLNYNRSRLPYPTSLLQMSLMITETVAPFTWLTTCSGCTVMDMWQRDRWRSCGRVGAQAGQAGTFRSRMVTYSSLPTSHCVQAPAYSVVVFSLALCGCQPHRTVRMCMFHQIAGCLRIELSTHNAHMLKRK